MKQIYIFLLMTLFVITAQAKSYSIAITISGDSKTGILVSIYSPILIEGGSKKNLSLKEAAFIIEKLTGGRSINSVAIKAEGVRFKEYFPLLKAISENAGLELIAIKSDHPETDSIWNMLEQNTAPNREGGPRNR